MIIPKDLYLENYAFSLYMESHALDYGIINNSIKQYLLVEFPVIPTFYLLPKVHKIPSAPPGRPIVSSLLATALPSYIRDSAHFIRVCRNISLRKRTLLVTCDVKSLYSNISHHDGLQAVGYFLSRQSTVDRLHDSFFIDLLKFILQHNYFLFIVSGVAMGACCAPAFANIFLGWWEETIVYNSDSFRKHVQHWHRFIDDVFFKWTVTFLDLKVSVREDGLITDLFRKSTATNSLLRYDSFHPLHTKRGIPVGQFLRIRRNCTLDEDFSFQSRALTTRFRDRGYAKKLISTAFQRAREHSQDSLLSPSKLS
ncbi:unnamed protein product [Ranitomeya imitator]|uniref:Helix-turn-helix domain-containing protein n=1 Tax=Ranitomeya imitator TaxID=111125 RepID=A0ABN9LYG3_9NEOB|nr:unnamed protein product [Ranitomeya imitator]